MNDRVAGESFLNSFDVKNLRDFNLVMVVLTVMTSILHRASWIGAGYSTAAKSPHEQKMAGVLGTWRAALNNLFYLLVALGIITVLNHQNFAKLGSEIKINISEHIATELVQKENRADFMERIKAVPEHSHQIGKDDPLSHEKDLDTPYMDTAHQAFREYNGEAEGNSKFQQYRTLYYQLMMASGMHRILPMVMMGMFCLLMVLAMISTDDTRIFSAALTVTQDVILPFMKKPPTPEQHIRMLRFVSIGIGLFYCVGSLFMSQLDYINLFVTIMCMMWMGGCGPVMIFGLYSRFGNTKGAFSSLITGMVLAFGGIAVQRNWADHVYPFLVNRGWAAPIGRVLETVSKPMNPYVVWKMDPVKFPINSYEIYILTMLITLAVYCIVSKLTQKEPFNLDRMLHRGIYSDDGQVKVPEKMTFRRAIGKMVGITSEYYFNKRPNKGMYDDLYVKVIVIESAGTRFGFMTFDLLGYSGELIEEVGKRIVEKFGRELFESIIICADHTHTGPEYGNPGAADERTRYAFNAAADAAMRALTRAVMNLQTGEIEIGSVYNNPYGFIRRYWMKDGTIVTNPGWRSGVSGVAPGFAPEALP